jgi:hypothetical protein
MSWPNPPYPFGSATSPEPMSSLDTMFNQVGAMLQIPCTASGTNAISLSPNVNCPALTSYNELGGYRFVAVSTSTAPVTAQYNGLGFLPVYHADGVSQVSTADIQIGQQYIFTFHQSLNGGAGGFYFEAPSQGLPVSTWFTPGGRLSTNTNPVNFTNTIAGNISYVPYVHPFVPIFNGATVQMYQFTTSLSDNIGLTLNMNGNATFAAGFVFDIFVFNNNGVLTLGLVAWTNNTTRAMTLSNFGGFLTNSGDVSMTISPAGTPSAVGVRANQATFLGSVYTTANGITTWQFPGASAAGLFCLSNYYNTVLFTGFVQDTGAAYTYTSATPRQAGARTYNQIQMLQTSSERAISFTSATFGIPVSAAGASMTTGIGIDSSTAFAFSGVESVDAAAGPIKHIPTEAAFSATGLHTVFSVEASDGTHANTFNSQTTNQLVFRAWL